MQAKLELAQESLEKMKRRNAKISDGGEAPKEYADAKTIIQLQQSVIGLSNRVHALENEVRELKKSIEK